MIYRTRPVHWRNFEAGYDVAELEPVSRQWRTYVLQEYFVPFDRFNEFVPVMAEILQRHRVNVLNISVRHAEADEKSLLAWARQECFAFVLYYKQRTRDNAKDRVAVWTRELIDAALAVNGTYYLPYQLHATADQFHAAYPRARELFALKDRLDPAYRLRGALWDRYYAASHRAASQASPATRPTTSAAPSDQSLFHAIYGDTREADRFYTFLQNIFHLFPQDRLHALIRRATRTSSDDEEIYRRIQAELPAITPRVSLLTHALPSLATQKAEMGRQTARLLETRRALDGYVEIGTTGRYVRAVKKHAGVRGAVTLVHDTAAGYSPVDLVERGQLTPIGAFKPLADYAPLDLPPASADLVSCFVGLHHMAPERLAPFLASVARTLRPGGVFVVRDHDVRDQRMDRFVALAHTVFNAGLGEPWAVNAAERRHFASVDAWIERIEAAGLKHAGQRLIQDGDPSDNVLMAFVRDE